VRSGAQDGIGFSLGSGSTGSTAWIESVSDDTNANLGIRAQGAGTITIGNSSNPVTIAGGAAFKGAYSTTFAWTLAAVSSGQQGEITLTTAVGGANPIAVGDLIGHISLNCTNTQMGVTLGDIRWSATASSVLTLVVGNITSTATSTLAGVGRITWLDLT
jgi:hypothetical protein